MIIAPLIVILCMTGVGVGVHQLINQRRKFLSFNELIINSLVISSGILIIPLIIFGLYKQPLLFSSWVYLYATISIFCYIIVIYRLVKFILFNYDKIDMKVNPNFLKMLIIGLIFFLIYVIYAILLPLRGYDALWMYLPDALWYYQTDSIPLFNILNFRPAIKEPIPSLFYTFSLYVTSDFIINFIPLIFFLAWSLLAVEFVKYIWPNHPKYLQWYIWPLFLVFPLNIWFMDNWAYYQDIYLGFFFSCAIFYYFKLFKSKNTSGKSYYYYLLMIFSISLAFFTKISAWILIILFILLLPSNNKTKKLQIFVSLFLFVFLGVQLTFRSFVGYFIIIGILWIILAYLLWKKKEVKIEKSRYIFNISSIFFGIMLGAIWLFENINRYKQVSDFIIESYFDIIPMIKVHFISYTLDDPWFILETAQSADFFAGIFLLFIGNYFALFWLIPKLRAIIGSTELYEIFIWIICTFSLWLTYYHNGSQRYLTPLVLPVIIIVYKGIILIWGDISNLINKKRLDLGESSAYSIPFYFLLLFLLLPLITLYFPLPLDAIFNLSSSDSNLGHLYLESAFSYYKSWFLLTLIAIILLGLVLYLIFYIKGSLKDSFQLKKVNIKFKTAITIFLLFTILMIPLIVPMSVFVSSNFNEEKFQQDYVYESRLAVNQIVDFLVKENIQKEAVLTLKTPGLPVWAAFPSIDLIAQKEILLPLYDNKNISYGLELFLNPLLYAQKLDVSIPIDENLVPSIKYVIIPNKANFIFKQFVDYYKEDSFLFSIIYDSKYFNEVFRNSEFIIYDRIFSIPFYLGPFDIKIKNENTAKSLVGEIFDTLKLNSDFTINTYWDLSNLKGSNVSLKSFLKTRNIETKMINWFNSTDIEENKDFTFFQSSTIKIPNNSFEILELNIELNYYDNSSNLLVSTWNYLPNESMIVLKKDNLTTIESGLGLVLSTNNIN